MSIADFHQKFVSATENNVLVQSLRRLSLLEDPKLMFDGDPQTEWAMWTDAPAQA